MACCPETDLCEMHRTQRYQQLKGAAECRGEVWGGDYVRGRKVVKTSDHDLVLALARVRVADLADDLQLRLMLAKDCRERFLATIARHQPPTIG